MLLTVPSPIYILTNSIQAFIFLHNLTNICYLWEFYMKNVRWYLIASISISLIFNSVNHLFLCLLAICISSLETCLFRTSTHFFVGLFFLLKTFFYWRIIALPWYWMVCLRNEQRSFCRFWDCIQVLHFRLFCWLWWLLHFF